VWIPDLQEEVMPIHQDPMNIEAVAEFMTQGHHLQETMEDLPVMIPDRLQGAAVGIQALLPEVVAGIQVHQQGVLHQVHHLQDHHHLGLHQEVAEVHKEAEDNSIIKISV
jgi:hypothetical protein